MSDKTIGPATRHDGWSRRHALTWWRKATASSTGRTTKATQVRRWLEEEKADPNDPAIRAYMPGQSGPSESDLAVVAKPRRHHINEVDEVFIVTADEGDRTSEGNADFKTFHLPGSLTPCNRIPPPVNPWSWSSMMT